LDAHPNNLPTQLTSFVGREKELEDVKKLLQNAHMLTLIGPGGTGKTRLSIQTAGEMLDQYPDGVWLVELAPILDPLLVPRTTAIAIGLRDEPQRPVIDMLCDYLHEKKMLILLDNCEHLVDACAQMADRILRAAQNVRILASSREALGIGGEVTYRVPSLGLPDMNHLPPIETLDQYEAVKLFIDRATSAIPSFMVTNDNAPALAQICFRLDGIPLAIELAAAKVRVLPVEQIAKRLDDRFRLLTGGSRTALERHQTLRAAIDWSYNLLPANEQVLFRRLSVFVDGWTLEAAEAVCSDASLKSNNVLDVLEHQINKSMVLIDGMRYHMLETIREYANEKLVELGESDMLRDRHLEYFLNLAETAEPYLNGPEQVDWLPLLDADYENLRLAFEWALSKETAEQSLNLCKALTWFWEIRCYWLEGLNWVKRALSKSSQNESMNEKAARAKALCTHANLEWQLDHHEEMRASAEVSLALALEVSDKRYVAIARFYLGFALMMSGEDNATARSLLERSATEFQTLNEPFWQAWTFPPLGFHLARQAKAKFRDTHLKWLELARKVGERLNLANALLAYAEWLFSFNQLDEARKHAEESDRLYEEIGSNTRNSLLYAEIEWLNGDYQKASSLFMEMQEHLGLLGEKHVRSFCIANLGLLAMEVSDLNRARAYLDQALILAREAGFKYDIAFRLVELSNLSYLQGNPEEFRRNFKEALSLKNYLDEGLKPYILMTILGSLYSQKPECSARLLGVIDHYGKADDFPFTPIDKRNGEPAEVHAREVLGDAAFESAFAEGQKMTLDEALDLALKTVEEM
jgi:predicted ATPase